MNPESTHKVLVDFVETRVVKKQDSATTPVSMEAAIRCAEILAAWDESNQSRDSQQSAATTTPLQNSDLRESL